MRTAAGQHGVLDPLRLIGLVAIILPVTAAQIPLSLYLPALYASQYGMPLATVGMVFLAARLWDAVSDPLIGLLSDRTRTRYGRRRPWIAAGSLIFGLATCFLFFPPFTVGSAYLLATLFVFYLGWTMIQIPLYAWMGELSGAYHQRTRIVAYSAAVQAASLLLILVLPTIADWVMADADSIKLNLMGGFLLLSLMVTTICTLNAVAEPELPARTTQNRLDLRTSLRGVFGDPLLLRVLASDFLVTLGQYIRGALYLFFVTIYVGLPLWGSTLFLVQAAFGILAGPIWLKIGYRLGKHRAVIAGELCQVAINLGLLFIARGDLALLVTLTMMQGLAQGAGNLMLRAIVADVADDQRLRTGVDRAGLLFSVFSLSGKAAMAVAIGVTLPLLAWLGFDPKGANSDDALLSLKLLFALGPALAHLMSAWLVYGFPLDERRHREIRAALDDLGRR